MRWITFSPNDPQLKDNLDLRKAISRAIDRDLINKQIFNDTVHAGHRLGLAGGGRLQGRRLR